MASLTVRLIFLVFTVLVVLLLGFSFQYSATAVNQEIERNLTQTSTLLQSLFDYKLGTMTTHQNSQAKSVTLQEFIEKNEQAQIDDYFFSVEKADLKIPQTFDLSLEITSYIGMMVTRYSLVLRVKNSNS